MAQYSAERKQAILNKLLSPNLSSIAQLAREENIADKPCIIGETEPNNKGEPCQPTTEPKS